MGGRVAMVNKTTLIVDNVISALPQVVPVLETHFPAYDVIASDTANIGDAYDPVAGSFTAPNVPPPSPTEGDYVAAVQVMLDTKAQERRYDNIASACTYDGDPDPIFAAEGAACKAWRSAVWRKCYEDLAKVQAGEMAQPTVDDFLASLPTLTWPG